VVVVEIIVRVVSSAGCAKIKKSEGHIIIDERGELFEASFTRGNNRQPPIRFFLNFSKTNNYLELPFSVAVHISLRHILTQAW